MIQAELSATSTHSATPTDLAEEDIAEVRRNVRVVARACDHHRAQPISAQDFKAQLVGVLANLENIQQQAMRALVEASNLHVCFIERPP